MNDTPEQPPDDRLMFLQELVEENASIDGDVAEIDSHTWAIHGEIPVDGEVILAEYETYDDAKAVLDKLPTHRTADPSP